MRTLEVSEVGNTPTLNENIEEKKAREDLLCTYLLMGWNTRT